MKRLRITYKWELIIMLWIAYFLNQGDRQIFNVVIPLIKEDLHLTDVQLGLVASVFTIVYGCLVPFGGYMGDFLKRKWIILISILIFSIGTLCTGFSGGGDFFDRFTWYYDRGRRSFLLSGSHLFDQSVSS